MTDRHLQLTLRELRADFTNPKGLFALACLGVLLGLSGPFETYGYLPLLPRILYWLAVTYLTYAVGAFTHTYLQYRFGPRLGPVPVQAVVYGLATALGVFAVLQMINALVFGWVHNSIADAAVSFVVIALISTIIIVLLMMLSPRPDQAPATKKAPAILDRLPLDKRGPLVALSVQDHYVSVTTTKGTEMLLMRLSDAIRETDPTNGLQVHRSHWVARDQIIQADRVGDRAILTLSHGETVPASRSYLPALRDAGVFPRTDRG